MCPWSCWSLPVTLLALVWGPGSAEEAFEVRMWPERLALEAGGSVVINCSTSCVQPEGGGLETTLAKELLDQQPQWVRYSVSNASEDTDVLCYFTCDGKQLSKSAGVRVFYPPKQVLLTLPPTRVAVGRSFTIECRVPEVAPLKSLTLTLFRGENLLHSQTFGEETTDPQEAVVTHNSTAPKQGGSHNFSCRAELDLQSLGGGLPRSVWASQVLEVYDPLKLVLLTLQPTRVAVGSSFTAECRVQAVAPLKSLTLTLFHGEKPLHNQTFEEESTDPQEAVVTHNSTAPEQAGSHTFSCRAELDVLSPGWGLPHSGWASQELEVYEPPQDNLLVVIIVVSLLLILFVTAVVLCFVCGQQWRQSRTGNYWVQDAWRNLRGSHQARPV
ncbi:intercellular adhesion molecule 2 isoform X2 [Talpa occidentalis]|nr:intercellular adhesion molecule 2 isoform X2 [Talpa occidentalis]XP_037348527.1 intercellular adhesion molecule 2 isoform X2 [Talpa occidentalis]XP_054544888.1 intercellular adhesion molecule 2 isoform X2 [Talpa occidentalis]